jgi:signal transduction histidine kinase
MLMPALIVLAGLALTSFLVLHLAPRERSNAAAASARSAAGSDAAAPASAAAVAFWASLGTTSALLFVATWVKRRRWIDEVPRAGASVAGPIPCATPAADDGDPARRYERSRDEFLAHVTHELRTPLTSIRAYAETLNDDWFSDEQTRRTCYRVIMTETQRLSRLIEDILSVSQIQAGALRLQRAPLRLDELLRDVLRDFQADADAKGIELQWETPVATPLVLADRARLHQVWTNLVGNALKYTPAGGRVSLRVGADPDRARVEVADTGIGIAAEHHERIFEKFYRVPDAAVVAAPGAGLGMSIARDIVGLHGGTIRVDSSPGCGARFIVELPTCADGRTGTDPQVCDGDDPHR